MLTVIFMLLLSEGQAGKALEPSSKTNFPKKSEAMEIKVLSFVTGASKSCTSDLLQVLQQAYQSIYILHTIRF
jgi:hypothetical protein